METYDIRCWDSSVQKVTHLELCRLVSAQGSQWSKRVKKHTLGDAFSFFDFPFDSGSTMFWGTFDCECIHQLFLSSLLSTK